MPTPGLPANKKTALGPLRSFSIPELNSPSKYPSVKLFTAWFCPTMCSSKYSLNCIVFLTRLLMDLFVSFGSSASEAVSQDTETDFTSDCSLTSLSGVSIPDFSSFLFPDSRTVLIYLKASSDERLLMLSQILNFLFHSLSPVLLNTIEEAPFFFEKSDNASFNCDNSPFSVSFNVHSSVSSQTLNIDWYMCRQFIYSEWSALQRSFAFSRILSNNPVCTFISSLINSKKDLPAICAWQIPKKFKPRWLCSIPDMPHRL